MTVADGASQSDIADWLEQLSARDYDAAVSLLDGSGPAFPAILLIEACRVLDYEHALRSASKEWDDGSFGPPEFDTIVRGWNPLLSILLPRLTDFDGIPVQESTEKSRNIVRSVLYALGRHAILKKSADMMRHGMVVATVIDNAIHIRSSDRVSVDHYLDMLEIGKLKSVLNKSQSGAMTPGLLSGFDPSAIKEKLRSLVFPWDTGHGLMVGYNADPEVDAYFINLVMETSIDYRDEAGIHPDAFIAGIRGHDLSTIILYITSFYVKHLFLVGHAKNIYPDTNYAMSLTIWKRPEELISSISEYADIPIETVTRAIDILTVRKNHSAYFAHEHSPYIPLLIEVTSGYLLAPISSTYRNTASCVRMLLEFYDKNVEVQVRKHRESWMISELYSIFLGTRYVRGLEPVRLKRGHRTVTDIDASIFDITTNELALFQLKWQDFSSSSVRKQRSKGKNFVDQVNAWGEKVSAWLQEFSESDLLRALHIHKFDKSTPVKIFLFAIGRSNARFASFGYANTTGAATSSWAQFLRIRYEVGPTECTISSIYNQIIAESTYPISRTPIPHEFEIDNHRIILEDVWSKFDETKE